jgi:hypothetical protein
MNASLYERLGSAERIAAVVDDALDGMPSIRCLRRAFGARTCRG